MLHKNQVFILEIKIIVAQVAQPFPTLIINQHIRMMSEGSWDIEDWRNLALQE